MILRRLPTLKILPILAKLLAPLDTGIKKNMKPKKTKKVSILFHLSAKKFSGPIAMTLMISSTTKIQTKTLSMVSDTAKTSKTKNIAFMKVAMMRRETASSKTM